MRRLGAQGGRLVGEAGSLRGGGTDEAWGCLGRGLLGGAGELRCRLRGVKTQQSGNCALRCHLGAGPDSEP